MESDSSTNELTPNISIVPNPNDGYFTIFANDFKDEDVVIEVFNSLTKMVYVKKYSNFTGSVNVNLNDGLPEGFYLVRLRNNNKIQTTKILLNETH